MYKVNGEALLQELLKLETDASEREARNKLDAEALAFKRGCDAEKTARILEVLNATDDDLLLAKEKISYLSAFVEEVTEVSEEGAEENSAKGAAAGATVETSEATDTVGEVSYGEVKY